MSHHPCSHQAYHHHHYHPCHHYHHHITKCDESQDSERDIGTPRCTCVYPPASVGAIVILIFIITINTSVQWLSLVLLHLTKIKIFFNCFASSSLSRWSSSAPNLNQVTHNMFVHAATEPSGKGPHPSRQTMSLFGEFSSSLSLMSAILTLWVIIGWSQDIYFSGLIGKGFCEPLHNST